MVTPTNTEPIPVHTTTTQPRKKKRTITSTFDIKLTQLKLAWWTQMYGKKVPRWCKFFEDVLIVKLPPTPHHQVTTTDMNTVVETSKFLPYNTPAHMEISKRDYTFWKRNNEYRETLTHGITRKQCYFYRDHTKLLIASFAAAHPSLIPLNYASHYQGTHFFTIQNLKLIITLKTGFILKNCKIITISNHNRQLGERTDNGSDNGI